MIRKVGNKWVLYSHSGKKLKECATKEECEKREREIQYFKHKAKKR